MSRPSTFQHTANRTYAVLCWIICAVFLVSFLVSGGPAEALRYGAYPLVLAAVGWTVFWRPCVVLRHDAVELVNVLSTAYVPYDAAPEVMTRWGLGLRVDGRTHTAWALPARSRRRRRDASPERGGAVGPRDRHSVISGTAEDVAGELLGRLPAHPAPNPAPVRNRINGPEVAVLGAAVTLAALTALVTG